MYENIFIQCKISDADVQYVCNETAEYQAMSTNTLSQVDFTMYALSQIIQNPFMQNMKRFLQ